MATATTGPGVQAAGPLGKGWPAAGAGGGRGCHPNLARKAWTTCQNLGGEGPGALRRHFLSIIFRVCGCVCVFQVPDPDTAPGMQQ